MLATYIKLKFDNYTFEFWNLTLQEIIFKYICEIKYLKFSSYSNLKKILIFAKSEVLIYIFKQHRNYNVVW